MRKIGGVLWLVFACSLTVWGQGTVPARVVVTMGHYYSREAPLLTADDLVVTQNNKPLTIKSLTPLRGDRAGLELFILVDNCSSCEVGTKLNELRRFIATQPSSTSVGVAYIQDGQLQVAANPTPDRDRAIKALSAPGGSKPSSPYNALADLMRGWKQGSARRVVLMISTGLDPAAADPTSAQSRSAEVAIEAAQRAEVTVYAIYHPNADYATTDFSKLYAGQVQLSHVADETGGEAYFLSFGPSPSIAPLLEDIDQHLANQYLLEFLANRGNTPGELQAIEVKSKLPDLGLMAPYKIAIGRGSVTGEKTKVVPAETQ
jgi:hypothetical protein